MGNNFSLASLRIKPKCDACGFVGEPFADVEGIRASAGMICPVCGAVMITADDVESMLTSLAPVLDQLNAPLDPDASTMTISVNSRDI